MSKVITEKEKDYSQWYNDVVIRGGLADHSAVRGCMVIKPNGYAIWEKMRDDLDRRFKETGHVNAYFPLLIPKSFFSREASHVEGFAKECAVVTHYRLKNSESGEIVVDPEARLEEELVVRPTSETIIWNTYKNWIQSYRDLPLLINQWANVMRWEMRTRLFLRTSEFLWQEGHTAHATQEEAIEETERMLEVYADFAESKMAIPVIRGVKTANERFAGALETYCIEALMQDGKALQAGTSHFLGQNFAKAFDVQFSSKEGALEYVWASSWGVSTRLIGALIMSHSDNEGLVIPPQIAPLHVVIVPIYKGDEERRAIGERVDQIIKELRDLGITVKYDDDDKTRPGFKFAQYELEGVPVRMAIGPRDLKENRIEVARRDTRSKESVTLENIGPFIKNLLDEIQSNLLKMATDRLNANSYQVNSYDEFKERLETTGGFLYAHWDGTSETEERIKQETKATIRCIPLNNPREKGKCILTGKPSSQRVIFARAY